MAVVTVLLLQSTQLCARLHPGATPAAFCLWIYQRSDSRVSAVWKTSTVPYRSRELHSHTALQQSIISLTSLFFSLKSMQNSYSLHFLSAVLFKQNSFFPSRAVCLEKARLKMAHSRACLNCSVQECCVLLSLLRGSDLKSYFIMSEGLSNHTGTLKSINRLQLNVPHWNSISWLSNTPGRWQTALNSHPKPTIPLLCSCSLLLATVLGAFNQIYQ